MSRPDEVPTASSTRPSMASERIAFERTITMTTAVQAMITRLATENRNTRLENNSFKEPHMPRQAHLEGFDSGRPRLATTPPDHSHGYLFLPW